MVQYGHEQPYEVYNFFTFKLLHKKYETQDNLHMYCTVVFIHSVFNTSTFTLLKHFFKEESCLMFLVYLQRNS
jgi:hypothetical protein